jgi:hypothetical protein
MIDDMLLNWDFDNSDFSEISEGYSKGDEEIPF